MQLTPMRYKNYIWPHNPRLYSIDYQRNMAVHKTPFGLFHLQDLGRTHRVMEGSGEFVGEDAYAQFGKLASVFYHGGAGLLIHPQWQSANAYFVSLRLEQQPRQDYVSYSFSFWEDDSWYSPLAAKDGGGTAIGPAAAGKVDSGIYHRVVKGDTLWGISAACGKSLQELIACNPQIKNPNLIRVGEKVRVG